jgi:hypothetical protein
VLVVAVGVLVATVVVGRPTIAAVVPPRSPRSRQRLVLPLRSLFSDIVQISSRNVG